MKIAISVLCLRMISIHAFQENCDHLEQRIVALESLVNMSSTDLSVLELVHEKFEKFVYSLTQPTDRECHFNYSAGRCYPRCMWYHLLPMSVASC